MRYIASIFFAASLSTFALGAQALTANQIVEKETTVVGSDGSIQTVRATVDKIVPGDRIVYSLNFLNDQTEAANDIVLTMPIPSEVKFIEGSADVPAATVSYSADGGETFSNRQSVILIDPTGNIRAASADELTHVRWTVPGPVEAGSGDALSFSATVR